MRTLSFSLRPEALANFAIAAMLGKKLWSDSMPTRNISLPPEQGEFVARIVRAGE
jgi:hypothetical protein